MKEMVKRVREEKDGFTIAELLIVVAIVAVLVGHRHPGVHELAETKPLRKPTWRTADRITPSRLSNT